MQTQDPSLSTPHRRRWVAPVLLGALLALAGRPAGAQTAHFIGVQVGSGLDHPKGVAVDGSGAIYIADLDHNRVLKETPAGASYTQTVVADSGLNNPTDVAVDTAGNVYIADNGNSRVLKETPSGAGYTESIVADGSDGLAGADSVAVDNSGNVYLMDGTNGAVLKEAPSGNGYIPTTVMSGLYEPEGLAVSSDGTVYIADWSSGTIWKQILSGGSYTQSVVAHVGLVYGLGVDQQGDVFFTDNLNDTLSKATVSGANYTVTVVSSDLHSPYGAAVDASGNIFVADTYSDRILKLPASGVNFGSSATGATPGDAVPLVFFFDTGGFLGTPAAAVLTRGATGLDYSGAGTGTCATNGATHKYVARETCTVDVAFAPTRPGLRAGAAQLLNASGSAIATAYVRGAGTGPQLLFEPGAPTTVVSGFGSFGVAVDASGDVYVSDYLNNRVVKETPAGSTYSQATVTTDVNRPEGLAVDGSGNVYIADSTNQRVVKDTLTGGTYTQTVVASGLQFPQDVAVDGAGNVYIADRVNYRVLKETLVGGSYVQTTIGSGLEPIALAVDGSGDVFIVDGDQNRIVKETPWGNDYTQSVIGTNITFPTGIAVDGADNVYIALTNSNLVVKETVSGSSYTQSVFQSGGLAQTLAVGDDGNVYFGNSGGTPDVVKLDLADAPSLTFATSGVGATSSDSPQTVTLVNDGNAALSLAVPAAGAGNPSLAAGFTRAAASTCPQLDPTSSVATLGAGTSCTELISFTPVSVGSISGALTITDDSLNASGSQQMVALSGTATQGTQTITFPDVVSHTYGDALDLNATASSALAVSYAVASGPATLTGSTLHITGVGAVDVTADQSGNANYTAATTAHLTFNADPAPLTVTAGSPAATYGTVPAVTANYSAFAGTDTAASLTTAPTCSTNQSATTAAGAAYVSSCTGAVDPNYTFTYASGGGNVAKAPLTVKADDATMAYGAAPPTLTGSVTGTVNAETITATYATTATSASAPGTYAITPSVTGATIANYDVTATNGTLTIASAAPLTLGATSLDFGNVLQGDTSAVQHLSVTNNGAVAVPFTSIGATGDFTETTTCGASLAPAGSCDISVSFKPTALGTRGGGVQVVSAAGTQPVPLIGTGAQLTLTAGSTSATVKAGSSATYTFTFSGHFDGSAAFVCAGAPVGATCTVNPASVTDNGGANQTVTVTLATTASSLLPIAPPPPAGPAAPPAWPGALAWGLVLAALLALAEATRAMARRRPARRPAGWALSALLLAALAAAGCGGGGASSGGSNNAGGGHTLSGGTPAGAYTLTMTATAGEASQATTLNLTVE